MEKIALNEIELAKRWGVSPKTLQRWRTEGRGPQYLKLSKRVVYPLDQIESYEHEALHASTWKKVTTLSCQVHRNGFPLTRSLLQLRCQFTY